jgi:hypothetical protein
VISSILGNGGGFTELIFKSILKEKYAFFRKRSRKSFLEEKAA